MIFLNYIELIILLAYVFFYLDIKLNYNLFNYKRFIETFYFRHYVICDSN